MPNKSRLDLIKSLLKAVLESPFVNNVRKSRGLHTSKREASPPCPHIPLSKVTAGAGASLLLASLQPLPSLLAEASSPGCPSDRSRKHPSGNCMND